MPSLLKKIHTFSSFRFIEFFFFCFAGMVFVNEWIMAYKLRFVPDIFDDSIKLVSGLYTLFGFVPYTDFAIVYPPGLLILTKILSLNFTSRFHVFAVMYLLLAIPVILAVAWKSRSWFVSGATILLLAFSMKISGELFVDITWFILFLATYSTIEKGTRLSKVVLPIAIFVLCLLKWERVVIFGIFMAVGYVMTLFTMQRYSQRVLYVLKATIVSVVVAFLCFIGYLVVSGSDIGSALYFVFEVPLKILPYRKLPLPPLLPLRDSIFVMGYAVYFCVFILIFLSLLVIRRVLKDNKIGYIALLLMPVGILPYAIGRADSIHAFPLLTSTFFSVLIFAIIEKRAMPLLLTMVLYFALHQNLFVYNPFRFLEQSPTYIDAVDYTLRDCRQATQNLRYTSLFVGRTNYSEYVYSHVMLYLMNPKVKPATKYISDEPGLQNTCEDGEVVAQELTVAKKPMLSLLEFKPQQTEANLSSSMVSCGYIEKWLTSTKYKRIGTCTHFGNEFEIRLYE